MPVSIIVDSSCDLTPAQAAAAGIALVPVLVRIGGQEFRDGVDLTRGDFYSRLSRESELPSTAPPSEDAFAAAFRAGIAQRGEAVCLTVSGKISKIFENASAGARATGAHAHVFDSKTLSGGLALLATAAARLARTGVDAATVLAALERLRDTQGGYAAYPDLRFLAKSGRINKAQMALGLMMNMFPVARVAASGEMESETTVRSWDQAKEMLASIASRRIARPPSTRVAITHTHAPELAQFVADGLKKRLTAPLKELSIYEAGPTVGANVGPGAAGLFFLEE